MTSTAIEPRTTDLGDGIVARPNGLEIEAELSFNDWRTLMERLLAVGERALWSIGDARVYGERFSKDYHDALEQIDASSRLVQPASRVVRAFPHARRRDQLSFDIHELVASLDEDEQESWLDDAERQGWNRRQMQLELGSALERVPVAAISVRAVGELRELCVRAAERRGMQPKEWVTSVLEKAAREELAIAEAAA